MKSRAFLAILPCLTLVFLSGCGAAKGTVTGKVTLNGAPLTAGTVLFTAPDGSTSIGALQSDGTYKAENVTVGDNKVTVMPAAPQASATTPDPEAFKKNPKFVPPKAAAIPKIDPKYSDNKQTPLTHKVTSGTTDFPIAVK